jgi:hypothetical protein
MSAFKFNIYTNHVGIEHLCVVFGATPAKEAKSIHCLRDFKKVNKVNKVNIHCLRDFNLL